jgi:hypothetical protein
MTHDSTFQMHVALLLPLLFALYFIIDFFSDSYTLALTLMILLVLFVIIIQARQYKPSMFSNANLIPPAYLNTAYQHLTIDGIDAIGNEYHDEQMPAAITQKPTVTKFDFHPADTAGTPPKNNPQKSPSNLIPEPSRHFLLPAQQPRAVIYWQNNSGEVYQYDFYQHNPYIMQLYSQNIHGAQFHFVYWSRNIVSNIIKAPDLLAIFHNIALRHHLVRPQNATGFLFEDGHLVLKQLSATGSHYRLWFKTKLVATDNRSNLYFPTELSNIK